MVYQRLECCDLNEKMNLQPNPIPHHTAACSCSNGACTTCCGGRQSGSLQEVFLNLPPDRLPNHLWISLDLCQPRCWIHHLSSSTYPSVPSPLCPVTYPVLSPNPWTTPARACLHWHHVESVMMGSAGASTL